MRELEDDITCAIQSDETVMITEERGAGKKFARAQKLAVQGLRRLVEPDDLPPEIGR